MVTIKRHIAKTISYRVIGTGQTVLLSYIFTGNLMLSSTIGFIELLVKPMIYFFHERIWYKWIKFGLK